MGDKRFFVSTHVRWPFRFMEHWLEHRRTLLWTPAVLMA
jgi:hypothetical protein